jgi:hypothetical protein
MSSDVAEHETHEIERVVVLRIELDRPLERTQRFLVQVRDDTAPHQA